MLRRGGRMVPSLRRAQFILPLWAISLVWMWGWWISSDYSRFLPLYIPLTLALLYEFSLLPSLFLYFVLKSKSPVKRIARKGMKVAVISPCVPNMESIDIVEKQLKAMSEIKYPHDSWILDEGNNPSVKALAKKYGVKHFSRKGIKKYNRDTPPFQKKTKAGNINAWLDHVKRKRYGYFVQLDIDHIPNTNYLNKTLGYFKDEKVAWVQAPSIYRNLNSWTARGAAEQELTLQGPLQMGFYGYSETPFIIGSHCTYRMSAIREIGGFQPTRAEDHLDTVYLSAKGYKGVFLPEIIAEGEGPETLNTYLAQQFAWAYSMFQVLMGHTPKMLKQMSAKRRFQFLFAQTWYPLWSLSYLIMFFSPVVAVLIGRDIAQVDPEGMLLHFLPTFICSYLVWWSARPLMQPRKLHLSWRGVILHAVRWPVILMAIISAAFKVKKPYMITPKGDFSKLAPSLVTYRPFLLLGIVSAMNVIIVSSIRHGSLPLAQAMYSIINAIFMLTICAIDISLRLKNVELKINEFMQHWLKPIAATAVLLVVLLTALAGLPAAVYQQNALAESKISTSRQPLSARSNDQLLAQIRKVKKQNNALPSLGMYDQLTSLPKGNEPYIQHSFVDWRDDHYFDYVLLQSLQNGNTPLITVEPRGDNDGGRLLNDIADGKYDSRLSKLSEAISASKNPVYIRFGHEMELTDLYPWGNQDPTQYKSAYIHVVDYMREHGATQARFVWSPAGNPGAEAYYPGDSYVDVVGTTVLYDQYWYGSYLPSFTELSEKRDWLQQYGKPVWIVEFGAGRANAQDQQQLINDAISNYKQHGFGALIYLDMVDANINGPDYSLSSPSQFSNLLPR